MKLEVALKNIEGTEEGKVIKQSIKAKDNRSKEDKERIKQLEKQLEDYKKDRKLCREMRVLWELYLSGNKRRARDMAMEESIYLLDELQKYQDKYGKEGV